MPNARFRIESLSLTKALTLIGSAGTILEVTRGPILIDLLNQHSPLSPKVRNFDGDSISVGPNVAAPSKHADQGLSKLTLDVLMQSQTLGGESPGS